MPTTRSDGPSRRRLFSLGGGVLTTAGVLAGAPGPVAAAGETPAVGSDLRSVTVSEGTNIAAAVSPDGRTIAFDLYGVLWLIPVAGGAARRLTEDLLEIAQPDWSPDGARLVFQAYGGGNFHLWGIAADGSDLKRLTDGPFDCREPRFSPDGGRIAFSSDRGGSYGVWVLDLATGAITTVAQGPGEAYEPAWSPDGRSIAYTADRARVEITDLSGGRRVAAQIDASGDRFTAGALSSPAFTPDGGDVIFTVIAKGKAELRSPAGPVVQGEDVFPFRVSWLSARDFIYSADGAIRRASLDGGPTRAIPFTATVTVQRPAYAKARRDFDGAEPRPVVGIGSPTLSPDGRAIAFRALNDIYLLPIGGRARPLTGDRFWKVDPAFSPDGAALAYSSDRGGTLDLWLRDLASGEDRQLTRFKDAAVSAAWSRDGKRIAFLSQNGGLHVVEVATGAIGRVYDDLWEPGKPSWSPDGRTIAYAAFKPYSARFREGLSEFLTVDVETGKGRYQPLAPHRSLGTRGDDGPAWSPDGRRMAFVFASRLHVADVDAAGQLTGAPRPINDEVTDAVSWSGDSAQLLYLSAGRLRLIPAGGGMPMTVPHGLTWANARPKGRLLVRAGRLWDGVAPAARPKVDVVIEGARIAAVADRGSLGDVGDARVIDASDRTVMPGLIEMHAHRQMQGYGYGDRDGRLWLSLGVTTTRSPGGPAYHMVEDREAIDSGARLGPRYFSTGEAIDGSRIFYNFMRPVTEPGQMALELQRAQALSYDLIKTYVRLSAADQKAVAIWAHARGLPLTSHYHYPALAFGMDGMEHMGATSRTGYSRTVSALGRIYQDVRALFLSRDAPRTPTLFTSTALFAEDRSLIEDARTRALYPPWEYARLKERAAQMAAIDRASMLAALAANVAEIAQTLRAGGRIVSGTDSPIDFNGVSLHMNLRAMVRYGLTPQEALVTATSQSGDFLGAPLGVIRQGALADLVAVDGDPLTRIEDAAHVAWVIKHGEAHTIDDLIGPFAAHAATAEAAPARVFACETEPDHWWHHPDYLDQARTSCCDGACLAGRPGISGYFTRAATTSISTSAPGTTSAATLTVLRAGLLG
jgi:Tol biopolymer transport system component/imidazolonepropionase-like amidohydrolase